MYNGKYEALQRRRRRKKSRKAETILLSLLLLVTMAIGGTVAYLLNHTDPVENTFTPSSVACEVTENFNGTIKKNVNVTNTGDTEAYIRVKLVTYRVNDENQHIGGKAEIPEFTPGTNWVRYPEDNSDVYYYYYTLPVDPGKEPADDLIGDPGITLAGSYNDADGGKQVIEVIAEAIQSEPAKAVCESWGVTISENSVASCSSGN